MPEPTGRRPIPVSIPLDISGEVTDKQEAPSLLASLWLTWSPAILTAILMGMLLGLLFAPCVQSSYDMCQCISQYGNTLFPVIITVFLDLPGSIATVAKVKKNSTIWPGVLMVIIFEFIASLVVFYAVVLPQYSYLEFLDSFDNSPRYYFGRTMGNIAVGQGRVFDKERRLIYKGGFDDNMYEGYGEEYMYDDEYAFEKEEGEDLHLLYRGDFSRGRFDGQGTYYGTDSKGTGSFQNGKYNGYIERWYLDERTQETLLYKGYYWNGCCHGPGIITRSDGSIYREGIFENGELVNGTYYLEDGTIQYSGEWANETMNGKGTWFYTNGNPSYYGGFMDGRREGYGTQYQADGIKKIYEGNWENNQYHGWGRIYQTDGKTIAGEGWFEKGEYFGSEPPDSSNLDNDSGQNTVTDN